MQIAGLREDTTTRSATTGRRCSSSSSIRIWAASTTFAAHPTASRALKQTGRRPEGGFHRPSLTPDTRGLLVDGTPDAVITQSPQTIVLNAVQIFSNVRRGRDPLSGIDAVRLSIVVRENLP